MNNSTGASRIQTLVVLLLVAASAVLAGCETLESARSSSTGSAAPPPPPPAPPPVKAAATPAPKAASPVPKPTPSAPARITLATDALFAFNQAQLTPQEKSLLAGDLLQTLRGIEPEMILVTGHADAGEKDAAALAARRAEHIKGQLVANGIDPARIAVEGQGSSKPVASCAAKLPARERIECAQPNRRVDIEVIGKSKGTTGSAKLKPSEIPVLFGTNRKRTGVNDPEKYFANEDPDAGQAEQLIMGRAIVRVPPVHTEGTIESPGWIRVTLQAVPFEIRKPLGLGEFRARDERRHFTFSRPIEELTPDEFAAQLKKELGSSGSKEALLYIHGYSNSFADAAFRAAQLAFDLNQQQFDIVPMMFSWPSDPGLPSKGSYLAARDRTNAAAEQLRVFLGKVVETTGAGVIHIVAHSMGAQVLATTLREMGADNLAMVKGSGRLPKFNQIILAAPDIRAKDFRAAVLPAIESGHRVVNYASSNDLALRVSKKYNKGARAGDTLNGLVRVDKVETIDASNVNSEFLGHSSFAESPPMIADLKNLMQSQKDPDSRGLQKAQRGTWKYWYFKCQRPQGC
jgi:esterase/lipase superfamily enzyme